MWIDAWVINRLIYAILFLFCIDAATRSGCGIGCHLLIGYIASMLFSEMMYVLIGLHLGQKQNQYSVARSVFALAIQYLEATVFFASCYLIAQKYHGPGRAFKMGDCETCYQLDVWDSLYFSFVTITTLGYGDIKPVGGWARFLVVPEVLVGIFILVVAVALVINAGDRSRRR